MAEQPNVQADLENRFKHHPPTSDAVADRYVSVRSWCLQFARGIVEITPASREQSLALTKLEEAMFWANAAIARRDV